MSTQISELLSTLLTYATNELTAHGIMLFAGFTATFAFLKLTYDYFNNDKFENLSSKILKCKLFAFFVLANGFLLSLPIYLLYRLRYYGAFLDQINKFNNTNTYTFYPEIYNHTYIETLKNIGEGFWGLYVKEFTYFEFIDRVYWSVKIGIVLSFVLLLPVWLPILWKWLSPKILNWWHKK